MVGDDDDDDDAWMSKTKCSHYVRYGYVQNIYIVSSIMCENNRRIDKLPLSLSISTRAVSTQSLPNIPRHTTPNRVQLRIQVYSRYIIENEEQVSSA